MSTTITGQAFVLGDDVDTDQIIPAQYLSYNPADPEERKYFGMYAMSGIPVEQAGLPGGHTRFVPEGQFESTYKIVIGGRNFGCGSSREHAPLAMAQAGVQAVVSQFYARIFFRNCVNGGYVLPCECDERLIERIATGDQCQIDIEANTLTHLTTGKVYPLNPIGEVKPIIDAGGIFDYASQAGMLKR